MATAGQDKQISTLFDHFNKAHPDRGSYDNPEALIHAELLHRTLTRELLLSAFSEVNFLEQGLTDSDPKAIGKRLGEDLALAAHLVRTGVNTAIFPQPFIDRYLEAQQNLVENFLHETLVLNFGAKTAQGVMEGYQTSQITNVASVAALASSAATTLTSVSRC